MQLRRLKTNRITFDYFLIDLIKTQLVFIELPKLANAVSGYKISYIFLKVSQYDRNIKLCQCITWTH